MQSSNQQSLQTRVPWVTARPSYATVDVVQHPDHRSEVHPGSPASPEPQPMNIRRRRPMTPQQAAEFLGLDDKTICRWARKGYLPAHAMGQGKKKYWRFFEDELIALLLEQPTMAEAA